MAELRRVKEERIGEEGSPAFLGLAPRSVGLPEPLSADIDLLDRLLGRVLGEQGQGEIARLARELFDEEAVEGPRALLDCHPELRRPEVTQALLRAFTILFQVLNTAEQKEIIRVNRERQARAGALWAGAPRSESIPEAVLRRRQAGMTA